MEKGRAGPQKIEHRITTGYVSIHLGCPNEIPEAGGLHDWIIFHEKGGSFWRLEVCARGSSQCSVWGELFLACRQLPSYSVHTCFSLVHVMIAGRVGDSLFLFFFFLILFQSESE